MVEEKMGVGVTPDKAPKTEYIKVDLSEGGPEPVDSNNPDGASVVKIQCADGKKIDLDFNTYALADRFVIICNMAEAYKRQGNPTGIAIELNIPELENYKDDFKTVTGASGIIIEHPSEDEKSTVNPSIQFKFE